ncbi:hypothetical protein SBA5_410055 [Candidatus Sulfotelmatomonas gaucii]|uniref:Uncharacterized protein n=1 Tax=Candidatus Sulfuritelmatomonas gaucii TaxID=2043161 RepID=A0A2N9LLL2_9BACT|nr:hypothetical protein SBA5_410055 [Candidatus Sulfotelmatomonas gaucii]
MTYSGAGIVARGISFLERSEEARV